jgi:putative transcriptional regulator
VRETEEPQVALGKAVQELRRRSGLTQETLAEKAGLTGRTVSAIETGRANPRWSTIRRIAAGLGVSMPEVAGLEEKHNALERRSRK